MGVNFAAVKDMFAWIGPVLTALQGNAVCDANPSCSATRVQFERLVAARNDGSVDEINRAGRTIAGIRRPADPHRNGEPTQRCARQRSPRRCLRWVWTDPAACRRA